IAGARERDEQRSERDEDQPADAVVRKGDCEKKSGNCRESDAEDHYFVKRASNAFRASSGVCGWRPLSASRSFTTLGWKNVHSLRLCLPVTRTGMFSRHSHRVVVSK